MSAARSPRFVPDPSRPYQLEPPFLAIWLPRGRGRDDLAEGLLCLPKRSTAPKSLPTHIHLDGMRIDDRLAWAKQTSKGLSLSWHPSAAERPSEPFEHLNLDLMTGAVTGLRDDAIPASVAPFFARGMPAWLLDEIFETALPPYDPGPPDAWLEPALAGWEPGYMASHFETHPGRRPDLFQIEGKSYTIDWLFCVAEACSCDSHRFVALSVAGTRWSEIASAAVDASRTKLVEATGDRETLAKVFAAWKERAVDPRAQFDQARARVRERGARLHAEHAARKPPPPPRQLAPLLPTFDESRVKPGRNDPCWCASGRKFKHCHGR